MIFKPKVKSKVKQKVRNFLVRAPILAALAFVYLTSVPMQTKAADSKLTLNENMSYFVKIGDYDIIETTGEKLNAMFDFKSELNPKRNYIAYYKIDTKKTGSTGWHTEYEYWHTKPWTSNQSAYGHLIPNVPTSIAAAKQRSDYIFGYQVNTSKTTKAVPNASKKTFYHYTKVYRKPKTSVGSGKIGTLHYFCTDEDTVTGQRFAEVMSEHPERDYVEFYISPVIQRSDGHYYYDCKS